MVFQITLIKSSKLFIPIGYEPHNLILEIIINQLSYFISDRELRALGIILPATTAGETTQDTNIDGATMATASSQVNPFHDTIDLSSVEG